MFFRTLCFLLPPKIVSSESRNKFINFSSNLSACTPQMFSYRRDRDVSNSWPQINLIRMCKWYCLFIYTTFSARTDRQMDGRSTVDNFLCRLLCAGKWNFLCLLFVAGSVVWISICYFPCYWIIGERKILKIECVDYRVDLFTQSDQAAHIVE